MSDGKKLIDGLIRRKLLVPVQLPRLEIEVRRRRVSLEQVLLDLGLVTERDLLALRSEELGVPMVSMEGRSPEPDVVMLIPEAFAREHSVIALERSSDGLLVACADPTVMLVNDTIRGFARGRVIFRLASRSEIIKMLSHYRDHYQAHAVEKLLSSTEDKEVELARRIGMNLSNLKEIATEQRAAIRILNLLILHALIKRASDIHLEPGAGQVVVKYRVDGVLHVAQKLPAGLGPALANRIKIMATLDIAERRKPQDGSFLIQVEGREIAFRIATMPTLHGEKVVMRILDKQTVLLGLENLGFEKQQYLRLRHLIQRPNGIILVAGPTGSGKTTTLYSILSALNTGTRNITTIEDPIEYQIEGITQVQVNDHLDLNFSSLLRSVLRQDPDVILLGEIRDLQATESAIRASLTGHMVFSTIHTNDAASAVSRLVDMGAESFLIASTLRGVISQRLLRALCSACRQPCPPDPTLLALLPPGMRDLPQVYKAVGCRQCFMTGYRGRIPIMELLLISDRLRQLIIKGTTATALQSAACEEGMVSIFEDGLEKIRAGLTTLDELLATVDPPLEVG